MVSWDKKVEEMDLKLEAAPTFVVDLKKLQSVKTYGKCHTKQYPGALVHTDTVVTVSQRIHLGSHGRARWVYTVVGHASSLVYMYIFQSANDPTTSSSCSHSIWPTCTICVS